jgi:hypothetical protein
MSNAAETTPTSTTDVLVYADTGAIVLLGAAVWSDRNRLNELCTEQKITTRNLNILNMNFKRWISIFVDRLLGVDTDSESYDAKLREHEKRIRELERLVTELGTQGIRNPIHSCRSDDSI